MIQSRRSFLTGALALPLLVSDRFVWAQPVNVGSVVSPTGAIRFELVNGQSSPIKYRVKFRNHSVLEASMLGLIVGSQNQTEKPSAHLVRKASVYAMR